MSVSLEHQQKVAKWREDARSGTLSLDDMKQAIVFLRGERLAMPPPKSTAKKVVDTSSLFDELNNL